MCGGKIKKGPKKYKTLIGHFAKQAETTISIFTKQSGRGFNPMLLCYKLNIMRIRHLVAIMTLFITFSCKSDKNKYVSYAEGFCKCMEPMVALQKKYADILQSGEQTGMESFFEEASKVDEEGQACMETLENKYGSIQGEKEEAAMMEALRKTCPDILAIMEQSFGPMAPENNMEDLPEPETDKEEGKKQ
jgi:hypothetical protein